MLDLGNRELMAFELLKSMLESPWYVDETIRKHGAEENSLARDAVALADALLLALSKHSEGSVALKSEDGKIVTLQANAVEEARRLITNGDQDGATKFILNACGASQASAKELVDQMVAGNK